MDFQQGGGIIEDFIAQLQCCSLFRGLDATQITEMLTCLHAQTRSYAREQVLLLAGQKADRMGVVLEGGVQVCREDALGRRSILARLAPGDLFAESFAYLPQAILPVTVIAAQPSRVLLIEYRFLVGATPESCPHQPRLVANMLRELAEKNLQLNRKINCLSKRTIREKLLEYLKAESERVGSIEVVLPFGRQELADYLCVDRSALSTVIGQLQQEGVLRCHRRRFELHF